MIALAILTFLALSVTGAAAQGSPDYQPRGAGGAQLKLYSPLLTREAVIADALSAAPAKIAFGAEVRTWDGTPVRQGNEQYVCFPTPTEKLERGERAPVCMDDVVRAWSKAWMDNQPLKRKGLGLPTPSRRRPARAMSTRMHGRLPATRIGLRKARTFC